MSEHPRKPGLVRVALEDGRMWLVSLDALAAEANGGARSWQVGAALDEQAVARLQYAHQITAGVSRALGMLARARRTRRELAQRLRRREPDAAVVEAVLVKLDGLGLLNDDEVARAEAASRFRRGEGAGRIRQSLAGKGVERSVIDRAIRVVVEEEAVDETAICELAARKRLARLETLPRDVQYRRLSAFLLRRGHGGSLVMRTVRELLAARPVEE